MNNAEIHIWARKKCSVYVRWSQEIFHIKTLIVVAYSSIYVCIFCSVGVEIIAKVFLNVTDELLVSCNTETISARSSREELHNMRRRRGVFLQTENWYRTPALYISEDFLYKRCNLNNNFLSLINNIPIMQ